MVLIDASPPRKSYWKKSYKR